MNDSLTVGQRTDQEHTPLRRAIEARTSALLRAAGIDGRSVRCTVEGGPEGLHVHLDLPAAVGRRVDHAVGVRVLDAVRSMGRTYGRINVTVSPST